MGVNAVKGEVGQLFDGLYEIRCLFSGGSQSAHAGVDFEMSLDAPV